MAVVGYIRVSTQKQHTQNQKMAILEYANKHSIIIDHWIQIKASTRRSPTERKIDELMENLKSGDTLIVSELSRIGRSVGQIAILVDQLIKKNKVKDQCRLKAETGLFGDIRQGSTLGGTVKEYLTLR